MSACSAGEFAVGVVIADAAEMVSALSVVGDGGPAGAAVVGLRGAVRRLRADLRTFRPVFDRGQVDSYRLALLDLDMAAGLVDAYDVALSAWLAAGCGADRVGLGIWTARIYAADAFHRSVVGLLVSGGGVLGLASEDGGIGSDGLAAGLAAGVVVPGCLRRLWRHVVTCAAHLSGDGVEELAVWAEKAAFAAQASIPVLGESAAGLASSCAELYRVLAPVASTVMARRVLEAQQDPRIAGAVFERLTEATEIGLYEVASLWPPLVGDVTAATEATLTPPEGLVIEAAGGVVWRRRGCSLEVLVVHRHNRSGWSLPKGKLLLGETAHACAHREVTEETGLVCERGDELIEVTYRDRNGRTKHVRYWAMQPVAGVAAPFGEVDAVCWAPFGEAMNLLTKQRDREVLASVLSAHEVAA